MSSTASIEVKCENCEIHHQIMSSNELACCKWYMDNVVCGTKNISECDNFQMKNN